MEDPEAESVPIEHGQAAGPGGDERRDGALRIRVDGGWRRGECTHPHRGTSLQVPHLLPARRHPETLVSWDVAPTSAASHTAPSPGPQLRIPK